MEVPVALGGTVDTSTLIDAPLSTASVMTSRFDSASEFTSVTKSDDMRNDWQLPPDGTSMR